MGVLTARRMLLFTMNVKTPNRVAMATTAATTMPTIPPVETAPPGWAPLGLLPEVPPGAPPVALLKALLLLVVLLPGKAVEDEGGGAPVPVPVKVVSASLVVPAVVVGGAGGRAPNSEMATPLRELCSRSLAWAQSMTICDSDYGEPLVSHVITLPRRPVDSMETV